MRREDLGIQDYGSVWQLQKERVAQRLAGGADSLILVEHPSVVTLGREHKGPAPALALPVFEVERGGRSTYHGPGQIVGYPIVHLGELGLSVDAYLRTLEEALIEAVQPWAAARRLRGFTGVWVGRQKLASIGIAVQAQVAYHGFALNVQTDLRQFALIHPCGLEPETLTSLSRLCGRAIPLEEVKKAIFSALSSRLKAAVSV